MLRKIASVLVLSIGSFCIIGGLVPLFLVLKQNDVESFVGTCVFVVIGIALLLGGTALWGWKRRRMVLGVVSTTLGGLLALTAIALPLIMTSPEWRQVSGPKFEEMSPIIIGCSIFGAVLLVIGIPLIIKQLRRDRQEEQQQSSTTPNTP